MTTLYITQPGARLEKEYDRIIITLENEVLNAIPVRIIEKVVLLGNIGITTPTINMLLDEGINLYFLSRNGKIKGCLQSYMKPKSHIIANQFKMSQDEVFKLNFAKQVVIGKLSNYEVMLRRLIRNRPNLSEGLDEKELDRIKNSPELMDTIKEKTLNSVSIDQVMGLEGYGSKEYFNVFFNAFLVTTGLHIKKRQRRPPKDPINAMLSLGYSLLTQSILSAIVICDLDPNIGFFHSNKPGRPSLALDLMEEFRPIIVDSLVLKLVNKGMIQQNDFSIDSHGALRLGKRSFKKFITQYQKRIDTETIYYPEQRKMSYRMIFEKQAKKIVQMIERPDQSYLPHLWR